jgi:hypothetical protein
VHSSCATTPRVETKHFKDNGTTFRSQLKLFFWNSEKQDRGNKTFFVASDARDWYIWTFIIAQLFPAGLIFADEDMRLWTTLPGCSLTCKYLAQLKKLTTDKRFCLSVRGIKYDKKNFVTLVLGFQLSISFFLWQSTKRESLWVYSVALSFFSVRQWPI